MTATFRWVILIQIFVLFISCASQNRYPQKPAPKLHDMVLAKGVDDSGEIGVPQNPSSDFTTEDKEIISFLTLENIHGKHKLRWQWLTPDGKVYLDTENHPFEVEKNRYQPKMTAWHRISIKDELAADLPGQWKVNLYVDKELTETKQFSLRDPVVLPDNISSEQKQNPKKWGLIIAIEDYDRMPEVQFARKDALIVRDYFIRILGVPEDNLILLIDKEATKSRIEGYLKSYLPSNVRSDSILYVYFAGHGIPDMEEGKNSGKGEPYLVPYDADKRIIQQTCYKLTAFYEDLNRIKLKQTFVFLDSCFSGMAARAAERLVTDRYVAVEDVSPPTNTIIALSSSEADQVSQSFPKKELGLFTYYLLRGLNGEANKDANDWITIGEIYNYVHDNVKRVSRRLKSKEQTPVILPPMDDSWKNAPLAKIVQ